MCECVFFIYVFIHLFIDCLSICMSTFILIYNIYIYKYVCVNTYDERTRYTHVKMHRCMYGQPDVYVFCMFLCIDAGQV